MSLFPVITLHCRYLSLVSWVSQTIQVLVGVFRWAESDHTWYVFFTLFSTYTLLPLPLLWSIVAGTTTSTLHLLVDVCCHYGDRTFFQKVVQLFLHRANKGFHCIVL